MEQRDLSEASGISMTSISNIEIGKVAPRRTTLMLWALATGVSYEWLATGKSNEDNDSGGVTQR
jgi:transcriptional regulator with XRE-family HTH domain